jgi:predicted NodU family carbamoyl transferase
MGARALWHSALRAADLDNLIDLKPDGSFRPNLDYFNYCTGLTMTNERFDALFGGPPRQPEVWLEQRHMDLAASVQVVLEECDLICGCMRSSGSQCRTTQSIAPSRSWASRMSAHRCAVREYFLGDFADETS